MTAQSTIGIISPGDMGHAIGAVLVQHGLRVLTTLQGRSPRTVALAMQAVAVAAGGVELEFMRHLGRGERRVVDLAPDHVDLVVLGVDSGDTRGAARDFLSAHGVTYPIVFDPAEELALGAYALPGLPVTYVINSAGRIVGEPLLGPVSDSAYSREFERELKAAL